MIKKNIETAKTARYYIEGNFTNKTEKIIIACHGYGELAENFLRSFDSLKNDRIIVIAPEALHRFYSKGFFGNVGASWMTKEDRLNEINDYINFLDNIYSKEVEVHSPSHCLKTAFGFSQGTATVCRWFLGGRSQIDELILWGGSIPNDIDLKLHQDKFNSISLKILIGNKDPFITAENVESERKKLIEHGIKHELIVFEGGHKINSNLLLNLVS
jgi:predicted esterase